MDRVTAASQGRLPRLIMYSVAMNPTIENAFLQGAVDSAATPRQQVRSLLNEAVQHFLANRVTTVAMACNTLQDELTALCRDNGLHNINMIDTTTAAIRQHNARRVLILGTASTYCDDLYGKRLHNDGLECIYPSAAQQDFIETYIRFALDQDISVGARQQFAERVRRMAYATGADGVVLACTDLSGDLDEADCGLMVFDSLQLLAQAASEHVLGKDELFV
ncbi:MAG: aspartate/glutamate racemase family protein [Candidatus Thiothrix singaporensis]|uniref:Aspartate/glutamate racemase family protein n=1 Tax=Candidatus Thiothrix singaporensis TaxID=2799669 RepID=A0A7L6ARQ1_9GAMM|nr:MAG: aspartate/glutamate racemase family protein [Candidatus Thiothrix singaporensis]